jgi:hypothetical protein
MKTTLSRLADEQSATGLAFPPVECYHEVARPGLYEVHACDALLFDGTEASRYPWARQGWTVDALVREAEAGDAGQ